MIAVSNITSGLSFPASNAGNSVWTTGTFTPAAFSVLMILHSAGTGTTAAALVGPTITGFGSPWTSLRSSVHSGGLVLQRTVGLHYTQIGASPSADSIQLSFATTQAAAGWIVDQVTGQHQVTPVVQSALSQATSNSTLTLILGAFASGANATYATFYHPSQSQCAVGTGLVVSSQVSGGPNQTFCSAWTSVNTTTPWAGFNQSVRSIVGYGVELAIAVGATGYYRRRRRG